MMYKATANTLMCAECQQAGPTLPGSIVHTRRCAFTQDGHFTPDNQFCGSVAALLQMAIQAGSFFAGSPLNEREVNWTSSQGSQYRLVFASWDPMGATVFTVDGRTATLGDVSVLMDGLHDIVASGFLETQATFLGECDHDTITMADDVYLRGGRDIDLNAHVDREGLDTDQDVIIDIPSLLLVAVAYHDPAMDTYSVITDGLTVLDKDADFKSRDITLSAVADGVDGRPVSIRGQINVDTMVMNINVLNAEPEDECFFLITGAWRKVDTQ